MIISLVIVQFYKRKNVNIIRKQKKIKKKTSKQKIIIKSKKIPKQRKIRTVKEKQKENDGIRTGKL